jgi:lysyl-tRNA synthetase class 2
MPDTPFWKPSRHADRRPLLLARNGAQRGIRGLLEGEGFIEVDPAGLQASPGNEAHLHGFATVAIGNDGQGRKMFLHTSPEFAMKKLLAGGEEKIFAFAHVWRNRERGALHSPEFTMLEWYRVGEDYTALMGDCVEFARVAARAAGSDGLRYGGVTCDPFVEAERLGVVEAFGRYAGVDLLATIRGDGSTDVQAMRGQVAMAGLRVAEDDTWSDLLARVLVARVEPHLGHGRMTILDRYPVAEAALARPAADDGRLAERFEIYACGVELANGFGELTDAGEQRRRFHLEMDEKQRVYGERYPLDEDFLSALEVMPAASGCAMGFDRLVMLATGAPRIDDVMWVPAG